MEKKKERIMIRANKSKDIKEAQDSSRLKDSSFNPIDELFEQARWSFNYTDKDN